MALMQMTPLCRAPICSIVALAAERLLRWRLLLAATLLILRLPVYRAVTQGTLIAGGKRGSSSKELWGPSSILWHADFLYIADTDNHRIQKCSRGGQCSTAAGLNPKGPGSSEGQLNTPYGVAVGSDADGKSYVLVADTLNQRVQLWRENAKYGTTIAGRTAVRGMDSSLLSDPIGVVLDQGRGLMYIVDSGNHRIQRWPVNFEGGGTGTTVAGGGGSGSAAHQLDSPMGIHVDLPTETIFIADSRNNRIQVWTKG